MDANELIQTRLNEILEKNYLEGDLHFKNKAHFKMSLEQCYALVANRTCQKWNARNGIDCRMSREFFTANFTSLVFGLEHSYIHSSEFKKMLPSCRVNGKTTAIPYSSLLEMLADAKIIHINSSYSAGVHFGKHLVSNTFTKSYCLDSFFMLEVIDAYLGDKLPTEPFNIYSCFNAYYPNKLLIEKIKEAESLYRCLREKDGIKVVLPHGWENQISPFGYFSFDEKLTIDKLISGINAFEKNNQGRYTGGRLYDWFTSCPSAFRKYLYKDGKHYRELVDCHSGIFWMFALYGYKNGRIDKEECLSIIDHCFKGTFYADISHQEKTKAVKQMFMKVMNMSIRQEHYMGETLKNKLFTTIHRGLSESYPQFANYLASLKKSYHAKIGKKNHFATIKIEKDIMDILKKKLETLGYTDLRRVHDALYGLEDIPNIETILYDIVIDYFKSINPRTYSHHHNNDSHNDFLLVA